MPASSNLLADIATVISNGPTANSIAKAIAAAGPIMDYVGNCKLVQLKFQESDVLLTSVKTDTDAGDTSLTQINAVLNALTGGGSPSTTLLTDMATVISNGPTAATKVKANAAAGPIMDYPGNCNLVLLKLDEAKVLLTSIKTDTDAGDTSLTQINNLLTALA